MLHEKLAAGETVFTSWCSLPEPMIMEMTARAGFGAVTMDMQHGMQDFESIRSSIAGLKLAGVPAVARIPVDQFPIASRLLDMGIEAVIAPMINSVEDAKAFVEFTKMPPVGGRSWGAHRAMTVHQYASPDAYLKNANTETLAIAMIETKEAVAALDDILAVEGIDGIFVGPADLSINLSDGQKVTPDSDENMAAIEKIAKRAVDAGKLAAAFAVTPVQAKKFMSYGIRFISLGPDLKYIELGAKQLLDGVK